MQTKQTTIVPQCGTRLSYRHRLYPTKAQASLLEGTLAVCRDVYNSLVHERTVLYETEGKSPGWARQCREVTSWKESHPELGTVNAQALQNVVRRVDLAFQVFFRRVREGDEPGYPRLKGKGQCDSLTFPQHDGCFWIVQGRLRLSKIGDINIRLHRPIEGRIKTCTVRRTPMGKWYACFSCVVEPEHLEPSDEEVGVDVGLKVFAALSNGAMIENPRFFRKDEKALAKAQRQFDKVKHKHRTKARRKAKRVVSRIHERVKHRRHDFVHQVARRLVNRFGVIAVEDLQVENMMASPKAKPDPENEGQSLPNGAGQKAGLNKSIADASWSMFRNVLTMKAVNAGRRVVAVNPAYTSQTCSGCGDTQKKSLSVRTHRCLVCGLVLDRDTNAAVNIVAKSNIIKIKSITAVGQYSLATRVA